MEIRRLSLPFSATSDILVNMQTNQIDPSRTIKQNVKQQLSAVFIYTNKNYVQID